MSPAAEHQDNSVHGNGQEHFMGTFVIAGGNSGIGLQVARNLLALGHRVILLGRNEHKGHEAVASFGDARDLAEFLSVDLSTHDGVRAAAARVAAATDRIDGLLHSAGEFVGGNVRTRDGIPFLIAVGYISRYHLTQLLLPNLLRADRPRVVMMTAHLNGLLRCGRSCSRSSSRTTCERS